MSAAMVVPLKLTREQFAALPDPEHGGKMELVDGRLVIMSPVGPEHGKRAIRIGRFLDVFAEEHSLGSVRSETGYWLGADSMRSPDISFISRTRERAETLLHGVSDQVPDLAIEVKSPSNDERMLSAKIRLYLECGVRRAWIVRSDDQTVTVYRDDGTTRICGQGDVIESDDAAFEAPGFFLPVNRIFSY